MDCDRACYLVDGYIDGELDLVSALEIEDHLGTCPECSRKYADLQALRAAVVENRAALFQTAPAALRKEIHAALRKSGRPQRSWLRLPAWHAWQYAAAVFALLLVVLAFGFGRGWFAPAPAQAGQLAQEVQSAHIRSLMADHLTDVTSTDQHTVKPWFNGKLDFSPPVVDLASQGFPLYGGRLDYLNGQQVAALVYHRAKHVINLFIWPTSAPDSAPVETSNDGYTTIHWNQAGMQYWAVSDVNPTDLRTFVGLVQKEFK